MLANNLLKINQQIADAAKISGRSATDVSLLAVTKTWGADIVRVAYELGLRNFGENYVQEALPKLDELKLFPDINWHFIGHLQSNKIRNIIGKFALIQTVDRDSVILELEKRLTESQDILLEVQLVKERQKAGAPLDEVPALLEQVQRCRKLRLRGLMIMPPLNLAVDEKRKVFAKAKILAEKWQETYLSGGHDLRQLSMGTSDDFQIAIEEGSTIVRLGTVLFGKRS